MVYIWKRQRHFECHHHLDSIWTNGTYTAQNNSFKIKSPIYNLNIGNILYLQFHLMIIFSIKSQQ